MRHRKTLFAVVIATLVVLVSASAWAAPPGPRQLVTAQEDVVWQLSKASVVDRDQVIDLEEGTLLQGYKVQAAARGSGLLPDGVFELTLAAFSPRKDMPGQKAGRWYVKGAWTITSKNAGPEARKARHTAEVIRGEIVTDLATNPLTTPQKWTALARIPMSLAGGRWGRAQGSFTVDGRFEGALALALERWPEVRVR